MNNYIAPREQMNFLESVYKDLDYKGGSLFDSTETPSSEMEFSDWLDKGEWLAAGKRAGVEKIFFVDNNPVAVFAKCKDGNSAKIEAFNKAWCLARPRIFFLESPGELAVYDLAKEPVDEKSVGAKRKLKHLKIIKSTVDIAKALQKFHRDNLESGRLFGEKLFGQKLDNRADKALIRDLKTVRRKLIDAGLSGKNIKYAHALIGRSIFIRYLEDRKIIGNNYFQNIAKNNSKWLGILENNINITSGIDFSENTSWYSRILSDKDFTYTVFKKLSNDFNGDMFPDIEDEEKVITQGHLNKIQDLLYANANEESKLFFYSYKFDIIPLDLISSIYEEFYHPETEKDDKVKKRRQDGAYYTPAVLAEFVLSRLLTAEVLDSYPRVLDPACGSGIFLVEAFRRIVRHKWLKNGKRLDFCELKNILKKQIAGIEVNPEAARIAAFSLNLSLLHYLEPKDIQYHIDNKNKLPCLVASLSNTKEHFHCILPENAFNKEVINRNHAWSKIFGDQCVDIVVGNPPWGKPKKPDEETKARHQVMVKWCENNNKPVGDQEPSQAFLWRSLDFLKPGGRAGILASAGVLLKHHATTKNFRQNWLNCVKVKEVFNFTHVRNFFFRGGLSPFISIFYDKIPQDNSPVYYWSAKKVSFIRNVQAVVFSKHDLNIVVDQDLSNYSLWKALWMGKAIDIKFLNILNRNLPLFAYIDKSQSARGFQEGSKKKPAGWLSKYKELPSEKVDRYSPLCKKSLLTVPSYIESRGKTEKIYSGKRILIKRGIDQKFSPKGQIISQFYDANFCFRNSLHCIKLKDSNEDKYFLLQGILWSSLVRYYYFLTSSNWGIWHDEIHLEEIFNLPVILNSSDKTEKVISLVKRLRDHHPSEKDLYNQDAPYKEDIQEQREKLESELDDAVFELFGLNEEQKDLIRDCCDITLPFFYQPFDSTGSQVAVSNSNVSWLKTYVDIFCRRWNAYLDDDEGMQAEVYVGAHENMIAIEFYPADKSDNWDLSPKNDWEKLLYKLSELLPRPMGTSQIILDGCVQAVSEEGIIIIKRNEKRLWTRSLAREDADAALCKTMLKSLYEER